MKHRYLGAVLLMAITCMTIAGAHPASAQPAHRDNTDPKLRQTVATSLARRAEGRADALIALEVLTSDTDAIENEVNRLAGTVTGSVDGQLVQALVPAGAVDALSQVAAARYVRQPLLVNRPVAAEAAGFGPTAGDEINLTNAAAWHDAGITGSVKVGIIDFFDLTVWNTAEHGPVPDAAHQFCPDRTAGLCTAGGQILPATDGRHGVAVAEIIKDMAPGAELFVATAETTADTQAAIDWFAANDVRIVNRSLGAPYDGPGDGTGPLDSVVDDATAKGITWFNSAGNDAFNSYGRFANGIDANGYIDFENGPGVDTVLRIDPANKEVTLDGIRWSNDWYEPPESVTDYAVEIWEGASESTSTLKRLIDEPQVGGAPPLEGSGVTLDVVPGDSLFVRIQAKEHYSPAQPDTMEVAILVGGIEPARVSAPYSAAKPVVDSRSPALVAVGAIDPANGSRGIAVYSSRGPTNDGRIKPDISAPSCVRSSMFLSCFNGTSAASPTAAGMAALLLGRGLAVPGMPLASLTRHLVQDLGPPGADNSYGAGEIVLPAPPAPVTATPSAFTALDAPVRLLDTRPSSFTGPANLVGPFPQFSIVDLPIASSAGVPSDATAVAVNVTSTDSATPFYVQALPTLGGAVGAFSTINIAGAGQVRPNFAIIPLGQGSISVFIPNGGNVIVDVMGYFAPSGATSAGRFVPIDPHRALDTRPEEAGPVPPGWVPHRPRAGEMVRVPPDANVPATGVTALVVNITATDPVGAGYLQALPTGVAPGQTSNVDYTAGETAATHAIVPLGADGSIGVFTSNSAHIVVDVMGYITDGTGPASSAGRFVPLTPGRYYDSRSAPNSIHLGGSTTSVQLTGAPFPVPAGATAISMNLTSDQAEGAGYITEYPADGPFPLASNLDYVASTPVANAALVKLSAGGGVNVFVNVATHVIIDVNGYFTGTQ